MGQDSEAELWIGNQPPHWILPTPSPLLPRPKAVARRNPAFFLKFLRGETSVFCENTITITVTRLGRSLN